MDYIVMSGFEIALFILIGIVLGIVIPTSRKH